MWIPYTAEFGTPDCCDRCQVEFSVCRHLCWILVVRCHTIHTLQIHGFRKRGVEASVHWRQQICGDDGKIQPFTSFDECMECDQEDEV